MGPQRVRHDWANELNWTPMFISTLLTIARTWKQPRCPLTDEWINKLWYIYTREYCSVIKRNAFESVLMRWTNLEPTIQSEVSQKEKYHILIHILESRKMVLMNLFAGQQWRNRHGEQTYGCGGKRGRRGWDVWRKSNMETFNTIYKIGSQWEFAILLRELKQGLCDHLEWWGGERDGREV